MIACIENPLLIAKIRAHVQQREDLGDPRHGISLAFASDLTKTLGDADPDQFSASWSLLFGQ